MTNINPVSPSFQNMFDVSEKTVIERTKAPVLIKATENAASVEKEKCLVSR